MKAWLLDEERPEPGQNWCRECGVHLHYPGALNNKREPIEGGAVGEVGPWIYECLVTCPVCSPDEYTWVRKAY